MLGTMPVGDVVMSRTYCKPFATLRLFSRSLKLVCKKELGFSHRIGRPPADVWGENQIAVTLGVCASGRSQPISF